MSQEPLLIESSYLPPIHLFTHLARRPVVLEAQETFQKRSFRNKCLIASDQGPQLLTVPLRRGKHQSQPIQEVAIAYEDPWQQQHVRSIKTCYRSAPFFDYFFEDWQQLIDTRFSTLWQLNWACLQLALQQLDLHAQISITIKYHQESNLYDLRGALHPRNYLSFDAPTYVQVFMDRTGFLPNLSVLDLIFCCGPTGRLLLQETK